MAMSANHPMTTPAIQALLDFFGGVGMSSSTDIVDDVCVDVVDVALLENEVGEVESAKIDSESVEVTDTGRIWNRDIGAMDLHPYHSKLNDSGVFDV